MGKSRASASVHQQTRPPSPPPAQNRHYSGLKVRASFNRFMIQLPLSMSGHLKRLGLKVYAQVRQMEEKQ